jgi:hypothetical protein
MKIYLISIPILLSCLFGNAQYSSKFDFILGYGFYEGYYMGSEYYFKKDIHSMSLSIGYDKLINKKQVSYALALGYDYAIFKSHTNKFGQFKWSVSNRAVLWQLEDEFYLWKAISLIPSIRRKFIITKKINMSLDVGPSFTIVLFQKRKTFEEVGWPFNYMPNFRISFSIGA